MSAHASVRDNPVKGNGSDDPGCLSFFGVADAGSACQQALPNGGALILPVLATLDDRVAVLADPDESPF